jgi:hypothetical protein
MCQCTQSSVHLPASSTTGGGDGTSSVLTDSPSSVSSPAHDHHSGCLQLPQAGLPSSASTIMADCVTDCEFISHHTIQVGYLAFNFVSSVVVCFINDAVFSKVEFGYPAYLCLNGFIITYLGTEIMSRWFGLLDNSAAPATILTRTKSSTTKSSTVSSSKQQQQQQNRLPTLSDPNFILLILVIGLSKTLSNASLKNNSMGVYQLFKLLVTPVVVLLEFGLDGKRISVTRMLWLSAVCVFVWFCLKGDMGFSIVGLLVRIQQRENCDNNDHNNIIFILHRANISFFRLFVSLQC